MRRVVIAVFVSACGFEGPDAELDAGEPTGPPATISIVIEAEMFSDTTTAGGHSWTSITNEPGYSGTSYMQCLPMDGMDCLKVDEAQRCGPSLVYQLAITQPDIYFVHARMLGRTPNDDSIWVSVDGTVDSKQLTVTGDGSWHWRTTGHSYSLAAGPHTLILWQREASARVDVVAVTNSAQSP